MKKHKAILLLILAIFLCACSTSSKVPLKQTKTPPTPPPAPFPATAPSEPTEATVELSEDKKGEGPPPARGLIPPKSGTVQAGLLSPPEAVKPLSPSFPDKDRQKVSFLFEKVDVAEVTNQIFGQFLKLNYVLDPTLQGRISFYLEGEFTKEELYKMITKAYEANNLAVVQRQGVYYIQPVQRSSSSGLPVANQLLLKDEKEGARPVIVIYRLLYMDAKQAINTVKNFLAPGRPIISDSLTNSVIFVEEASNARGILDVLKALDINVLQEVSMEIVPLRSIAPADAAQSVEALVNKLGLFKESNIKNSVAFIPLQNFGGVLVLAQNPELLKTAKYWLTALDVQGEEAGDQIHVYFVQNSLAADIANILTQTYGIKGAGVGGLGQQVVESRRTFGGGTSGSWGRSGTSSGTSTSRGLGSSSSSSLGSSSSSTGSRLSGTSSTTGTGTGTGMLSGGTGGGFAGTGTRAGGALTRVSGGTAVNTMLTGEVTIIPDEVNNAIVTRANAADYAKIKKTIETLDILPRVVLIEVTIAEITLNKNLQYGVEWFLRDFGWDIGGRPGRGTVAHSSTATSTTDSSLTDLAAVANGGLSLFWGSADAQINVLINLLSSKTDVSVLSTPTLLATDNKEATITVGGREPISSGTVSGGDTGGTVVSSIQYEETGIILNVIPHINAGGLIRLEVEQTIRNVGASVVVGNTTSPRFTERHIQTTMLAHNGKTVIIGGIIQQQDDHTKTGIPFVEDVPLLSPFFSSKSKTRNRTELIIAITPHVVEQKGDDSTREFLEKLKDLRRRIES